MKQNFKRKLLAGLLSACMMLQTVGTVPVYAADSGLPSGTSSVCTHHVHDENCGYTEGSPCTFDPATCESCKAKGSNAQELSKENIVEAETISEPAPQTANTVTLDIAAGAIKISSTGYERYDGSKWTTTEHNGSYVITGTRTSAFGDSSAITVSGLADNSTLTLKNLTIESTSNQTALSLTGNQTVHIEGTVKLGGLKSAIEATGALNLVDSGSLALSVVNSNSKSPNATAAAVISAASVAAKLTGDITVTATTSGADIHAIQTTVDGAVSLTSQNGAVSLTSGGTTAPLIMSAGAVTISGHGDVAVTNATGGSAIIAGSSAVSLTSEIGAVNVTGNGNFPAIQASAVTIRGYGDISVESTGGPAIIAGGGDVSLTSESGWVKVIGKGKGSAIQASAVTISGKTDVVVTSTGGGSGISASGEVSLTSQSRVVEVRSEGTAISSGKLTIHSNGRVLVSSTGSDQAIRASGAVELTSDNSNVEVNGNGGNSPAILASTLTIAAKGSVTVKNGNADNAIMATGGAVSLNANDIYIGGLISASNSTVTFTAPEGAIVRSESTDQQLITGTVTVAENTQLQLLGNTEGITYANDGSEGRTTAYAGDLSTGGEVNAVGTYLAGNGTIVVTQSDDGKYTATMTNASVGGDLQFGVDCTLTLVGKNQVENGLYLLNEATNLTINGTGGLVASNIEANNITISGGTVNAANISGDGENGTISITDGTVNAANISSEGMNGTISITGGTVNADTIVTKTPSIDGGTVNAIVQNITIGKKSVTVYGNVTLTQDLGNLPGTSTFTAPAGTSLTVPSGVKLNLTAGINAITNSGTMTINGELMLPTAFKSEAAIKGLKLTGNGSVKVDEAIFFTDGSQPHTSNTALTFTTSADAGTLTTDGYEWKKDTKTLTLKNLWLEVSNAPKAITLPDGAKLVLQGMSTVIGKDSAIYAKGNLTVSGATGILKAGYTSTTSGNGIEVEETLTVDSGTILSAGKDASMCANAIAITAGTIDLGAHGTMTAMTKLTISGGNVTTGDGDGASLVAKDIVISGGKVKTGGGSQGSICAAAPNGGTAKTSITITGGTVNANEGSHPFTHFGILAMNGDISITGGTVTATGGIDSGSGVIVGGGIAAIDGTIDETITGTITTPGMTATTTPVGGTVKTGTVATQDTPMKVTSYTADATLQAEGGLGMITNACTTVSLAKKQTPPITPPDGGDGGSTGGGSTGGGDTTPSKPKPEPPKTDPGTGNTEVSVPVKPVTKGDTASATVPEKSVSDAIAAAEKEAAKTGGSASVTVTVDAPKGAKTVETTLPSKSLSAVADGKTEGLKISTPVADLSFDSEALKNIAGMAGKDVKISAAQVDTKALTDTQKSQVGDAPVFDFTVTSGDKTISNFNGGTATVSVPYTPKEGENPEFVTVWLLDDAGKLIPIEAKYKDGKIAFETGHFSRYAIGYLPFTDVKADWAYESIVYVYQNKLFSGVGDDKFAPTANMNRAMLWTVLYRMAGSPGKTENPATWYADAQAWAMANGISDGTNPTGNITREQLATLLFRYAKAAATAADMSSFIDTDEISAFAKDGMSWAVERKILQGNSGKLNPAGNATRAQVAAVLRRYVE